MNREHYDHAQELRGPLTNIIGLIELLDSESSESFKTEIIKMLKISAQSLDNATRTVIDRYVTE